MNLIGYNENFDPEIGTNEMLDNNDVTYINTKDYQGTMITNKRIYQYENGILGITDLKYPNWMEFVQHVQSLCKVHCTRNEDGDIVFCGSCPKFWKEGC